MKRVKTPRIKKIPYQMVRDKRHLSMRVAGSHNYSRSAPALQFNVDLLSAKGSKEPIDSSHVSILAY